MKIQYALFLLGLLIFSSTQGQKIKVKTIWKPVIQYAKSNDPENSLMSLCVNETTEIIIKWGANAIDFREMEWLPVSDYLEIERIDKDRFTVRYKEPTRRAVNIDLSFKVDDKYVFPSLKNPPEIGTQAYIDAINSMTDKNGNFIESKIKWVPMSEYYELEPGEYTTIDRFQVATSTCGK